MMPLFSLPRHAAKAAAPAARAAAVGSNSFNGVSCRQYNFASTEYKKAFGGLPIADGVKLRQDTIAYLDSFDAQTWYSDPVTTVVNGSKLSGGASESTIDAFNYENGTIVMATDAEVDAIIAHMKAFKPQRDYRDAVRKVEAELFEKFPAQLIGNQAVDFRKQDGVTEIEESVQANLVERRLNDQLLADEDAGRIKICRAPAYVGCVSNFSNFLDLSRKTLRNIELGVPAVVLSRSNTTQHMYRWTQMLVELMAKHGVDPGLVTYASCSLANQQKIMAACPEGAMYITSSRQVAEDVRAFHGNVMSSTGGPNTLVAARMTKEISDAVQLSAMIENSGQCTALRHACVGGATEADMKAMFENAPTISSPQDALRNGAFAGVFDNTHPGPFKAVDGYTIAGEHSNIAYRIGDELPPDGVNEMWRQTYVDMTSPKDFGSDEQVSELAGWLVRNQPISLAMNTVGGDFGYARKLFEQTGQVVYTVGQEGNPALTCQARPQEGEIFGEFPVRRDLQKFTRYPVFVPSPTAAYNCHYDEAYLASKEGGPVPAGMEYAAPLLNSVLSAEVRGFCVLVMEYLSDACGVNRGDGKNTGGPDRTTIWGLQRPPMDGQDTVLRCAADTSFDELAPTLVPFYVTNAGSSVRVSVDPANSALVTALAELDVTVVAQSDAEFEATAASESLYNVIRPEALADNNNTSSLEQFPMVGQFVSLYFPMGHIKSTTVDDEAFVEYFSASEKWLKCVTK
mmetsp:Transcript_19983/g.52332  ORF Transcript_19983/g.52332 Transcript_19983/m.52332 type:complete len:740 (-) Transcript_19983:434-2653(-)